MAAMLTVSAIFLRWVQHHGLFTLTLCTVTLLVAGSIYRNQRRRYGRAAQAIAKEVGCADPLSVFGTALAAGALGVLGLYTLTL